MSVNIQTSNGKLKVADKSKKASISIASSSDLGVIKVGDGLEIEIDGTLNVVGGGGGDLPIATTTRLGGVKIGAGINVATDGTISASNSIHQYSESEQIVGKWVDDSNVYEKTFIVDNFRPAIEDYSVLLSIDGASRILNSEGLFVRISDGFSIPIYNDWIKVTYVANNQIRVIASTTVSSWLPLKVFVTVKYLK